ncbi:bpX5 domain-containing protein [Microtetraspora malaysiensis]|uniref:MoxR-vWA-beta-propeller ternary system domain-containing protein n=1 Tax=Microtetraspora malaysiensis TaxID=161358 RepID=A0ABW6T4D0_9ACTN
MGFALGWVRREPPLRAVAVAGSGSVAVSLAGSVRSRVAEGAALRVAAADDWLLVLGDSEDLPWADGACYLGLDGGLLVPTTRAPMPSAVLWRDHLLAGERGGKLAVLMPGQALVTDVPIRPVDPTSIPLLVGK